MIIIGWKLSTARSIEIVPRGGPPFWLMGFLFGWYNLEADPFGWWNLVADHFGWWILEADSLLGSCMLMNSRGGPPFWGCMLMNSRGGPPQLERESASMDNFYGSSGMYATSDMFWFHCVGSRLPSYQQYYRWY